MGKFEDGCYGSTKGIALIAKVLAGRCKMRYTRVAAGKGAIPDGSTPKTMEEPAEYVMDAMISAVTNPVDGECQVTVQINSANVESGFYVTGLLLYAEDPDEGEVPFTYLVLENEPEWIRPSSSIVGKLATFDLIAAVGDVDKVSAAIDVNSLATAAVVQRMIEEHNLDNTSHADIRRAIEGMITGLDITIPAAGWVSSAQGKYKYRLDVAVENAVSRLIPLVTVLPTGEDIAVSCGLCPTPETLDGALRVRAAAVPSGPIAARLVLIDPAAWLSGGGSGGNWPGSGTVSELPLASATTPGVVKPGAGLRVLADGTLIVDTATDEEFRALLNGEEGT